MSTALIWFRHDLRLRDNAALTAASKHASQLLPLYIHDPESESPWQRGSASRWWLHHSLIALNSTLEKQGTQLILRCGNSIEHLKELAHTTGADRIFINRRYEPHLAVYDARCAEQLNRVGIEVLQYSGALLTEPESLRKEDGTPYRVFTPFWKAFQSQPSIGEPLPAPSVLSPLPEAVDSIAIGSLGLLPRNAWTAGLETRWHTGEISAQRRLQEFLDAQLENYGSNRDLPGIAGTSALSPHLAFGEISPRDIWFAVQDAAANNVLRVPATEFLRQLVWREFAYHILHHHPDTTDQPLDVRFERFSWAAESDASFEAWSGARTGIPLIDAGMRELWQTGTMHNRTRMVVASFLTKNLLIPWQRGSRWFWDTLVDADLANNSMGWQWVAGCGVDAAPYFRIFNPIRQGERFDPHGNYVRRWIPELQQLEERWIHQPWLAPNRVLQAAGVRLNHDYPRPIIDLQTSRKRALERYDAMKRAAKNTP